MAAAARQRTMRSWRWTALVHALVLALILAVSSPFPAEAEHQAHPVASATFSVTQDQPAGGDADICLLCHHHCGCLQAAFLDGPTELPLPMAGRVTYRPTAQQIGSISIDSLLRPPRA